jgi:branched-chain amino acid transport system permease protein
VFMLAPIAQNLVYGILVGGLYGLAAVGLSLVFGVTKFLNVAHGELLMLGGYASFWLFTLRDVDPFLSLPVVAFFLVLIGFVLYKLLFARMVTLTEDNKIKNTLLVGFGLSLIFQTVAKQLWTADDRGITTDYSLQAFTLFGVRFPIVRVASLAVALICLLALHLFLRKTYTGKAIRATVQDWEAATVMGIDIHRVYLLAFVVGAALAGVAGALVAVGYSIQPTMGLDWTLIALVVMVLGGLGSILGTFVGGLVLGVTQSLTNYWPGAEWRWIVALLLFLVVLILRPQGLFGSREG